MRSCLRFVGLIGLLILVVVAALPAQPAQPQESGGKTLVLDLGGGMKMEFVRIPHGKFLMGSPEAEKGRKKGEDQHEVEITRDFYFGKYEVTRGQFAKFLRDTGYKTDAERDPKGGQGIDVKTGKDKTAPEFTWKNPGFEQADDHPVLVVSWYDAVIFCDWLRQKSGKAARLPTEAEWEYACRAGTTTRFHSGDDAESRVPFANMGDASAKKGYLGGKAFTEGDDGYVFTAPVGKFKPNPWGLYDMHGNAYEWCQDWYGPFEGLSSKDPLRADKGTVNVRCIRGGSWNAPPDEGRSADRHRVAPTLAYSRLGFRVVVRAD